jgi:molecular chaperone DnaJ
MKNYYEILGVDKNASDQEIKKAFRRAAQKHHPDKHKGDKDMEQKFKDINEAYQVLSDQQKRQNYDQFGSADGPGGFGGGGFGGGNYDFSGGGFGGFSDIFESFFGGGGGRSARNAPVRGDNIEGKVNLSFEEAAFGIEKKLEVTKLDICDHCKGSAVEPGSKMKTCPDCGGSGEIRTVRNTLFGQFASSSICTTCEGSGKVPEKKCSACYGKGRLKKTETIKVKIPAGIDSGSTIRLSGKGEAGIRGGGYGDLYVHIDIKKHEKFEREGANVLSKEKIHPAQAALGAEISISTIHGDKKLQIPSGTQSGSKFTIAQAGMERLRGSGIADHIVEVIVETPDKISKKEKELWEELAKEADVSVNAKKGWFS